MRESHAKYVRLGRSTNDRVRTCARERMKFCVRCALPMVGEASNVRPTNGMTRCYSVIWCLAAASDLIR